MSLAVLPDVQQREPLLRRRNEAAQYFLQFTNFDQTTGVSSGNSSVFIDDQLQVVS